ncbi:MAG: hypothetical protein A3A58_03540 [Candidatus Blackburnbacteria bacterium RIFCSPLOWO2_01_FULL_41_27]|uniref:Uncharacterized protein n=2 Tax=Candidatus Blackburniibacteriota TaxID=1817898 RepID=A0A1G1V6W3_9BACT|nr:MAG: hypothetical protein A3F61_04330 [Candidatus Blackburnbacteria bacterium RIFCSPHIGHO2_12_FULL_41_13b]OGY13698.1 MAG: hypothetical protein A3A58_03540 [Candidatus Blackburnbacteria bacterium RIFCSPLOWO2_01_FULL_41_27]
MEYLAQRITNPLAPGLSPTSTFAGAFQFESILQTIVSWLLVIAVLLFFFYFLIGGIKWITSAGDKNSIESARGTIMHALVGIVIVFAMFAVIKIIEASFSVCILNFTLPGLDVTASKSCAVSPVIDPYDDPTYKPKEPR